MHNVCNTSIYLRLRPLMLNLQYKKFYLNSEFSRYVNEWEWTYILAKFRIMILVGWL